jgi:hypothetical protein
MPPFVPTGADPFAPRAESSWKKESLPPPPAEMPVSAPESLGTSPFWGDTPDTKPPVSSFMLAEPEESAKPVSPFPAFQPKAEPPKPLFADTAKAAASAQSATPVVIPANPVTGTPEVISEPPVFPVKIPMQHAHGPSTPAPKPAPKPIAPALTGSATTRNLLLTVLLGSPDAENVDTFIKLTRLLPGVAAAVCLRHGSTLASQGDGTTEADRFIREASANAKMLPSLAALTGIADTDTLHIQSGHGEATFCLHDDVVLAVLHNPERREAVLREKITLLGRELAAIVREQDTA